MDYNPEPAIEHRNPTNITTTLPSELGERTQLHRSAALAYTRKGIPVFPCNGKEPLTKNGFKDSTTDPRKINLWWSRWPSANIGVPTGRGSGFFVLDIDSYNGGQKSLDALTDKYGKLPHTIAARTGRGGMHLLFVYPDDEEIRNSADRLGPGLDVRGEGGYIIVPPSRTEGPYEWLEKGPLSDPPEWLLKFLRSPQKTDISPGLFIGVPSAETETIVEGCRNHTVFWIGCSLRSRGASDAYLRASLLQINEERCSPPLPEDEVEKIVGSVCRFPIGDASSTTTDEVLEILDYLEDQAQGREKKGMGAHSRWAVYRALIDLAQLFGRKVRGGVEIGISMRDLALASGVGLRTLHRALEAMSEPGLVRRSSNGSGTKAGALVLRIPKGVRWHHSTTGRDIPSSGATLPPISEALYRLRWGAGRIGKTKGAVLEAMARGGVWRRKTLAEKLGKRPTSLRDPLRTLVDRGLVDRVARGEYRLPDNFVEILERETLIDGTQDAEKRDRKRYERQLRGRANRRLANVSTAHETAA